MFSWFRGVVWPRPLEHQRVYRYAIIGMLITDKPLSNLDGNEFVLDGPVFALRDEVNNLQQKSPAITIGDANMVLTSLDEIIK
jgi:hypothetical protein